MYMNPMYLDKKFRKLAMELDYIAEIIKGDEDSLSLLIHKDRYGETGEKKYSNDDFMVLVSNKTLAEHNDKLLILGGPDREAIEKYSIKLARG